MTRDVLVGAGIEGFNSRKEAIAESLAEIRDMAAEGWGYRVKRIKRLFHLEWYKKQGRFTENGSGLSPVRQEEA